MGKINQKIGKFHYNDIEINWGKFILINQLTKQLQRLYKLSQNRYNSKYTVLYALIGGFFLSEEAERMCVCVPIMIVTQLQ